MSKIPTPLIPSNVVNLDAAPKQQNRIAAAAKFDAMLFSSESNHQFADDFLGNIMDAVNIDISSIMSQALPPGAFPFTADFTSTFGTSGPLPAFINLMSSKLGLNAAQNQAFQQIAVNNKDATRTPESIDKIAAELKAAGIGYA